MPAQKPKPEVSTMRPEVYRYHDYLTYLKDWLAYRKASQPGFSFRALAKEANLAVGYLPMVLSGKRHLSSKSLSRLVPILGLDQDERYYFGCLVALGTSDSQDARLDALERMRSFRSYQKLNPKEIEVYQYLTHWYYVAIREMAALPDFKAEPSWIQSKLRIRVPLSEVKAALDFLTANGYIELSANGSVKFPEKDIQCLGGVYRLAIVQYHREMFSLAAKALDNVPSKERDITGHTMAIPTEAFEEVKSILKDALERVAVIAKRESSSDSVYHVIFAAFPLTQNSKGRKNENKE